MSDWVQEEQIKLKLKLFKYLRRGGCETSLPIVSMGIVTSCVSKGKKIVKTLIYVN